MGKFNLSEETFARGLMDNDFRKIKKRDGRVEYAWGTSEHATIRGKETTSSYESKSAGQRGDIAKFQKTSQSWKIGLFQNKANEGDDGDGEADEAPRMAIEDDPSLQALTKKQWKTAKSQISHAIAAVKKIGSDARKILDKVDEKDEMYVRMCLVSVQAT